MPAAELAAINEPVAWEPRVSVRRGNQAADRRAVGLFVMRCLLRLVGKEAECGTVNREGQAKAAPVGD